MPTEGFDFTKTKWAYQDPETGEYIEIAELDNLEFEEAETVLATYNFRRVTYCKDCINNKLNTDAVNYNWCYKFGYEVDDEDFCSYGEAVEG